MFRRALTLLGTLLTLVAATAAPSFALYREDGDEPDTGLSVLETLGYFVGAPVLLYLVITVIVMAFTGKRGGGVTDLDRMPLSERD